MRQPFCKLAESAERFIDLAIDKICIWSLRGTHQVQHGTDLPRRRVSGRSRWVWRLPFKLGLGRSTKKGREPTSCDKQRGEVVPGNREVTASLARMNNGSTSDLDAQEGLGRRSYH